MAELKKYLDQAGLQVLWNQAKAKFIDNSELTAALANYETIEDLERDYFNKTQVQEKIDALASVYATQTALAAEVTRATAAEATKLNKLPNVDDPEDPGYGYPYHIPYDVAVAADESKIDLTLKTLTLDGNLTKMNFEKSIPAATTTTAGLMTAADKVLVNKVGEYTMVKDSEPGEYAAIYHLTKDGVNIGDAIQIAKDQLLKSVTVKTCTEEGKPIAGLHVGDKYIDFEFETTSGTSHSYIAVKDMVTPYTAGDGIAISDANVISVSSIGVEKVTGLQTALDAKALATDLTAEITRATAAEATKTTQELTNANGKSQIMNESDGGGIFFVKSDNTSKSFLGVNDSTLGGPDAQIYAINPANGNAGAKIDILKTGMYYTVGSEGYSSRVVPANEIATVGKVVAKPVEPVAGQGVNVPYYFSVAYAADKATVTDYTVDLLDNTKAPATYNLDIVGATASAAGLMVAADKDKLDNIDTLTQAEIEAICQ